MSLIVYLHTTFILFMLLFCIKAYLLMADLFNYLKTQYPPQNDGRGRLLHPPPPPYPLEQGRQDKLRASDSNEFEGLQLSKYEDGDVV